MAAASVASFSSQPLGQGGTFSPLTMFECTISSATMLIDNMAVRDLLVAFKIVAQLHGHLLEVLDPTVQRLVTVADEHSMCPPPVKEQPMHHHMPGTSSASLASVAAASAAAAASVNKKSGILGHQVAIGEKAAAADLPPAVKPEVLDSDDDCVLMEADLIFDQSQVSSASFSGRGGDSSGAGGSGGSELSNEWKGVLRKAYRVLKDETGSNVFDFSLPYSARVNVMAANRVIDKALALSRQRPTNVEAWRNMVYNRYLRIYYTSTLKPARKHCFQKERLKSSVNAFLKLNRRQKSYETMKDELDTPGRAKFESVLTRDYTSSDEEGGTDLDSEMKVRSLPWESDELRSIKEQLDEVFLARLADDKQRAEIARLQRDPGVVSSRPPPADNLQWTKNPAWVPPVAEPMD